MRGHISTGPERRVELHQGLMDIEEIVGKEEKSITGRRSSMNRVS